MVAAGWLTVLLEMMQPSPADSLKQIYVKEKTEDVERADWQEDRHVPDLR